MKIAPMWKKTLTRLFSFIVFLNFCGATTSHEYAVTPGKSLRSRMVIEKYPNEQKSTNASVHGLLCDLINDFGRFQEPLLFRTWLGCLQHGADINATHSEHVIDIIFAEDYMPTDSYCTLSFLSRSLEQWLNEFQKRYTPTPLIRMKSIGMHEESIIAIEVTGLLSRHDRPLTDEELVVENGNQINSNMKLNVWKLLQRFRPIKGNTVWIDVKRIKSILWLYENILVRLHLRNVPALDELDPILEQLKLEISKHALNGPDAEVRIRNVKVKRQTIVLDAFPKPVLLDCIKAETKAVLDIKIIGSVHYQKGHTQLNEELSHLREQVESRIRNTNLNHSLILNQISRSEMIDRITDLLISHIYLDWTESNMASIESQVNSVGDHVCVYEHEGTKVYPEGCLVMAAVKECLIYNVPLPVISIITAGVTHVDGIPIPWDYVYDENLQLHKDARNISEATLQWHLGQTNLTRYVLKVEFIGFFKHFDRANAHFKIFLNYMELVRENPSLWEPLTLKHTRDRFQKSVLNVHSIGKYQYRVENIELSEEYVSVLCMDPASQNQYINIRRSHSEEKIEKLISWLYTEDMSGIHIKSSATQTHIWRKSSLLLGVIFIRVR